MSSFVVIEHELHEKFEVAHYPTMAHDPTGVSICLCEYPEKNLRK
jgi:hypothetical protein